MSRKKLINGIVLTPLRELRDTVVLLDGGKIQYVGPDLVTEDYETIDCGGNYLAPGFIDLHVHGGGGHDFMDGTAEAMAGAAKAHALHGTTSLLPTGIASDLVQLKSLFDSFAEAKKMPGASGLLGIHLEGPYYAHQYMGAMEEQYLRNPEPEEYEKILSMTDNLRMWSIAPELPGAMALGRYLRKQGVLPAIGHSGATFDEVSEAVDSGYSHVTHLYSCTSTVVRKNCFRVAGIIEAAFYYDSLTVEIIADGVHLPEALLRLVYKLKGADKATLISDSIRAAGQPDGTYFLGNKAKGRAIQVRDGISWLPDGSGFGGGTGTGDLLVRNMVQLAGLPVSAAVQMMTLTPAKILGLAHKGRILQGCDADLAVFDKDINMQMVILGGELLTEA